MVARFVKAAEIDERCRVSRDAVYLWIHQGKIPADCVIRIAGTVRVDEEEFEKRLKREAGRYQHRWTDEGGSVQEDHPNGPDKRAPTTWRSLASPRAS
jgi:hypothetical protein